VFLLDTNIVSDLVRNPQGVISQKIAEIGEDHVLTSIIVAAELRYGAERRGSDRLSTQLEQILGILPVLAFDGESDIHYGKVRADLERRGVTISANDLFIAAHALSTDAILVSDNVREFERVNGLKLENWLRP
jgi:tRNA(fMet)-specific endonuclease VapC